MFISDTMPHHPITQIEIIHRLKKVGFTQEQAETHAQIVTEVNESSLATKQDLKDFEKATDAEFSDTNKGINDLQKEMRNEFVLFRKEVGSEFALVRKEVGSEFALVRKEMDLLRSEVKKDMEALKFDLTTRISLIITSALAIMTALQKFIL